MYYPTNNRMNHSRIKNSTYIYVLCLLMCFHTCRCVSCGYKHITGERPNWYRGGGYIPKFSALSKNTLTVKYRVYIWQVSPQLSCGDTCQIWMWFEESNMYFCKIENFAYGEINERSFSNPHPRTTTMKTIYNIFMYGKVFSINVQDGFLSTPTNIYNSMCKHWTQAKIFVFSLGYQFIPWVIGWMFFRENNNRIKGLGDTWYGSRPL